MNRCNNDNRKYTNSLLHYSDWVSVFIQKLCWLNHCRYTWKRLSLENTQLFTKLKSNFYSFSYIVQNRWDSSIKESHWNGIDMELLSLKSYSRPKKTEIEWRFSEQFLIRQIEFCGHIFGLVSFTNGHRYGFYFNLTISFNHKFENHSISF